MQLSCRTFLMWGYHSLSCWCSDASYTMAQLARSANTRIVFQCLVADCVSSIEKLKPKPRSPSSGIAFIQFVAVNAFGSICTYFSRHFGLKGACGSKYFDAKPHVVPSLCTLLVENPTDLPYHHVLVGMLLDVPSILWNSWKRESLQYSASSFCQLHSILEGKFPRRLFESDLVSLWHRLMAKLRHPFTNPAPRGLLLKDPIGDGSIAIRQF